MVKLSWVAVLAPSLVSSCYPNSVDDQRVRSSSAEQPEARLMIVAPLAGRMEAAVSGPLLVESGCAVVERRSGKASLVWSGEVTTDDTGAILYANRRFVAGDLVRFGGGFITAPNTPGLEDQIRLTNCPGPYFLVQSVEEITP